MQWFTNHQRKFLIWVQMIHRTYSSIRNVYFLIFTFVNKFPDIDLKGSRNVQFCMDCFVMSQWSLHPLIVCWLHFSLLLCKDHNVHIYGGLVLLFETVIRLFLFYQRKKDEHQNYYEIFCSDMQNGLQS